MRADSWTVIAAVLVGAAAYPGLILVSRDRVHLTALRAALRRPSAG